MIDESAGIRLDIRLAPGTALGPYEYKGSVLKKLEEAWKAAGFDVQLDNPHILDANLMKAFEFAEDAKLERLESGPSHLFKGPDGRPDMVFFHGEQRSPVLMRTLPTKALQDQEIEVLAAELIEKLGNKVSNGTSHLPLGIVVDARNVPKATKEKLLAALENLAARERSMLDRIKYVP
jgi:hypothetical protein